MFAGPMSGGGGTSADAAAVIVGAAGDMAGWSVATGDPNGDDAVDLLIGLPGSATAGAGSGAVSLTYGPVSSGSTAAADVIIEGSVSGEALGHSLSAGGDVDGDAYVDVVLGAPDSGGTGATYLFLGRGL